MGFATGQIYEFDGMLTMQPLGVFLAPGEVQAHEAVKAVIPTREGLVSEGAGSVAFWSASGRRRLFERTGAFACVAASDKVLFTALGSRVTSQCLTAPFATAECVFLGAVVALAAVRECRVGIAALQDEVHIFCGDEDLVAIRAAGETVRALLPLVIDEEQGLVSFCAFSPLRVQMRALDTLVKEWRGQFDLLGASSTTVVVRARGKTVALRREDLECASLDGPPLAPTSLRRVRAVLGRR